MLSHGTSVINRLMLLFSGVVIGLLMFDVRLTTSSD
jgi:hypothetical protein